MEEEQKEETEEINPSTTEPTQEENSVPNTVSWEGVRELGKITARDQCPVHSGNDIT